jgi:pilus assembly protein Flp/PilA
MMTLLRMRWRTLRTDEAGASSIEYAILASGIAVAIVAAVQALGTNVTALFTSVQSAFH